MKSHEQKIRVARRHLAQQASDLEGADALLAQTAAETVIADEG